MNFYNREEAVRLINQWGAAGRPFIFIADYKAAQWFVRPVEDIDPDELLYNLDGFTNDTGQVSNPTAYRVEWTMDPVSFEAYAGAFRIVREHLLAGDSYLVNLTCATPLLNKLDLKQLFQQVSARYKVWMKDHFLFFSPEIFVKIAGGRIYSYPMKGTIDATLPDAYNQLQEDEKEICEHATIVDLIRNDLSMVATDVAVTRYRYIERLETNRGPLLQASSEISGRLPDGWKSRLGDILLRLLPAGSISGAPKKKTCEIIEKAESAPRGFYTGVSGYFDGNKLDSAVMIRFIEQKGEAFLFRSGGGITTRSLPEDEYNEMIKKVYVPLR
ncbi:MAG: aminodeoxychorismate synthase component I [Tannerellaceae bacterium]|nr:aminodeoxychorismate synthase component I [Tannerellaceae bacterium]